MYSEIAANKRKTIFLILGFFFLIAAVAAGAAWYFGDYFITIYALVFALGYIAWSYFGSDKAALAINNAQEIQKSDNPRLWRTVENLAITNGLPMPKVYIMDDPALNAFATGRDPRHASVAVTTGLLNTMDDSELQGVMAHEMGHIQNYDIRVAIVVFGLVAVVSIISDMILRGLFWGSFNNDNRNSSPIMYIVLIVALIIAPIVATIIQLSISRKREYLADATGALTTRYPEGLASALEKIEHSSSAMQKQSTSTAHLFFANPLKGKNIAGLFSTHPPIEDRIARLREMGTKA
ncbi:zinc metalloprotease HtpX [Candidatus Saccharibacteria bacterium]|nr:zinc metalloprotease HtpX [Candidatus Saccharibacteria bacterium]MCB9817485.1 zinc metalloprotease HtpX [Candidatus Nomurabacteria bacterium]HPD99273.1 zinc metalloprotease HtpX [Candidatus Saccharibacteria bacterium]